MIDPAEIADVVFHAPKELVAQVGAGGELGHLDEKRVELLLSARETVTLEPVGVCFLGAVFGLDIAKIYPWTPPPLLRGPCPIVSRNAQIAIGFDPIPHCFEVARDRRKAVRVSRGIHALRPPRSSPA